jgi:hypothetical protein
MAETTVPRPVPAAATQTVDADAGARHMWEQVGTEIVDCWESLPEIDRQAWRLAFRQALNIAVPSVNAIAVRAAAAVRAAIRQLATERDARYHCGQRVCIGGPHPFADLLDGPQARGEAPQPPGAEDCEPFIIAEGWREDTAVRYVPESALDAAVALARSSEREACARLADDLNARCRQLGARPGVAFGDVLRGKATP